MPLWPGLLQARSIPAYGQTRDVLSCVRYGLHLTAGE